MKNNFIEAVLFDLDGVLVDACEWHRIALNEALNENLGFTISEDDHFNIYNGLPTKTKLKMLNLPEEIIEKINHNKQEKTLKIIEKHAILMEEKIELHNFLKNNNIKIACVTNSINETAKLMLNKTGQFPYMDLLVTNEMVIKNKPDPECYNYAIDALGANHERCICVEDSKIGIESASKSKAKFLWKVNNFKEVNKKNYIEFIEREVLCKY